MKRHIRMTFAIAHMDNIRRCGCGKILNTKGILRMKRLSMIDRLALASVAALSICSAALAGPSAGVSGGKYVFTVPADETYTLTSDDVSAAMSGDNLNYPFAKQGAGCLVVGDVMADYPNDIYILEGQYKAVAKTSFGTSAGVTYVDGGTLWSTLAAPAGYDPAYGNEAFHLKGTGCDNLGALRHTDAYCMNFANQGGVVFDGDVRVTGSHYIEFRYGTVDCNGHALTVAMDDGIMFRFVALEVANPGSITVESGTFSFESSVGTGDTAKSVTVEAGGTLHLNMLSSALESQLVLKDGASIGISDGFYDRQTQGQIGELNNWAGTVAAEAMTPVVFRKDGCVFNLLGAVSGAGGFTVSGGGYLQFANTNNTFAGGVCATGIVDAATDAPIGGVSVVKTSVTDKASAFLQDPFAALPPNGDPVRLENAQLGLFNNCYAALPDVVADGRCVITGDSALVKATIKSLSKTGSGTLTISGPFHVTGAAEISAGTLRFGSHVPCGLNWYYKWMPTWDVSTAIPSDVPFVGVDRSGVSYAYDRKWPTTEGNPGNGTHDQVHYYTGYIRIPGEEGAEVSCNFVSSMARYAYVVIDGTEVVRVDDNIDKLTETDIGYSRFYVGPQVVLTAGWKPIFIRIGNRYDNVSGPLYNTDKGWEGQFGLGVDWSGRCEATPGNYAKFLDPGDGSFLRPTLDGLDSTGFGCPSFDGSVAFAPGTVFDVNDTAPFTPVAIASLVGVPAITNGEVHVSGTWTLRAADVTGGVPLTVAAGSTLKFEDGATMSLENEELIPAGSSAPYTLIRVADGGVLEGVPTFVRAAGSLWKAELSADGKEYNLVNHAGFILIVR